MNYKTILLSALLIILIVIIVFSRSRSPVQKRVPLIHFPIEDIYAISISDINDTLYIVRDSYTDGWQSIYPYTIPLSSTQIATFFTRISDLRRTAKPLSDNQYDFEKYNVTLSTGTRVTLIDADGITIADYIFGMSDIYTYGAVRQAYDNKVYELDQYTSHNFPPRLSHWREHTIYQFNRENVDSLFISSPSFTYKLTKQNNQWQYTDSKETFPLTDAHLALHYALSGLENLRTQSFVDYGWDAHSHYFDTPILTISIYTPEGGQEDTLTFAPYNSQTAILKVNDHTDTLYLCSLDTVNRWQIPAQEYKKKFSYSL